MIILLSWHVLIEKIFVKGHNARVKKSWTVWNEETGSTAALNPDVSFQQVQ